MRYHQLGTRQLTHAVVAITSVCLLIFATNDPSARKLGVEIQPERKIGAELKGQETKQVRIAQQFGLGYLPLMVARQYALIEKHAGAAGIGDLEVIWNRYPSGDTMNQALRGGFLDIASGGIVPLLRIWDRTKEGLGVKGIATLSSMPLYLNTNNPKVKSLKDFTDADRIALPIVKESIQAVILQMAVAQTFGKENYALLDRLTVSMAHPDGLDALLSGKTNITAHLTSPPFQYQELENPNIRKVFSSYDVLEGSATFTTVWTRSQFRDANPKTFRAIYNALREAADMINKDKRNAAEVYDWQGGSSLSIDAVHQILSKPEIEFTTVPLNVMQYAEFMHEIGAIKSLPEAWTEVFFPEIHSARGN